MASFFPAPAHPPAPPPGRFSSLTEYERFHGHTHIDDIFRLDLPTVHDAELRPDRPDASTPEHIEAWTLAKLVKRLGPRF